MIEHLEKVSDTIEDWLNGEFITDDSLFEALENALVAAYKALQREIARSNAPESDTYVSDWTSEVL